MPKPCCRFRRLWFSLFLILVLLNQGLAQTETSKPPRLQRVAENLWLHTSYKIVEPWGNVLSHGLIVRSGNAAVMVDTAWTEEQTVKLLDEAESLLGGPVLYLVVTHAHEDKMAGIGAFHGGRPERLSFAHPFTIADAPSRGFAPTTHSLQDWEELGLSELRLFYPGPGHTRDNIVVYHRPSLTLFGGCLVRPGKSRNLGNTGDADLRNWANSVRRVRLAFPEAKTVIPSHGEPAGAELLEHTIALADHHQLESFWIAQNRALDERDFAALSELFTEEARLFTLAGGEIRGRENLRTFWQEEFAKRLAAPASFHWQKLELLQTSPETASLHGRWEFKNMKLPPGYPDWGYFVQNWVMVRGDWRVKRAYFWGVTEGHTRHLRPKLQ